MFIRGTGPPKDTVTPIVESEPVCVYVPNKVRETFHYPNIPLQYAASFKECKIDIKNMKEFDNFPIFAQSVDCEAVLPSTHHVCFSEKKQQQENNV